MKRFMSIAAAMTALAAVLFAATPVMAQPPQHMLHLEKGSLLLFPLFDATAGSGTTICVTNTNTTRVYIPGTDYRTGDVVVHFQYVDGEDCLEFDRYEYLSPGDTLCVIVNLHNVESKKGYAMLSAVDPSDIDRKIDFDYLIGSALIVQSDLNYYWMYTPYAFKGIPAGPEVAEDATYRPSTDFDMDGAADFDGHEYSFFPRELFIDSFFEETDPFANELTLMSTAGQDYINEVDFLFWNNIEDKYSRTFKFTCWWKGPLSEISLIAKDLNGLEGEIGKPVETGWVSIRGNRILDLAGNPVPNRNGDASSIPPLVGVFAQFITSTDFAAGHALHYRGKLDGLEILNGNSDGQIPFLF